MGGNAKETVNERFIHGRLDIKRREFASLETAAATL